MGIKVVFRDTVVRDTGCGNVTADHVNYNIITIHCRQVIIDITIYHSIIDVHSITIRPRQLQYTGSHLLFVPPALYIDKPHQKFIVLL